MRNFFKKQRATFVGSALAVCILGGVILSLRLEHTKFIGDESGWISSGYYYTDLLLNRDFEMRNWNCPECGSWGSLNMHLGKWLIGIPLILDPQLQGRSFTKYYEFKSTLEENLEEGRIPPRDILLRARSASVVFGILCCLLVFVIGYSVYNVWIAWIAVFLLLSNELFIRSATRAMTDIYYNFFLLCLCLTVILLLKIREKKRALFVASLCGILAGLACSVKVTGIVVGGTLFLAVVIYMCHARKLRKTEIFQLLAAFSFFALVLVYALNPYFWPSWKETRGKAMIQELRLVSQDVKATKFNFNDSIERYPQLYSVFKFPMMFSRWSNKMDSQRSIRHATWSSGRNRFLSIHKRVFISYASFPLELIFLGIGILVHLPYIRRRYAALPNPQDELWHIPLLYFLINYIFILLFLKLNWERYYLPTVIADRFIVAIGVWVVVIQIYRSLKGTKNSNPKNKEQLELK